MHLPRGHGLAVTAEQHLIALANQGFPVIRAMPGRLFQQPTEMPVVVASMERMLISDNAEQVQSVAQAITRWRRAAAASLIPSIPRCLFDLLLARFALRQRPGLDGVAAYWLRFVEEEPEQLTTEQEKGLFLALDELVDETAPQRLRDRFNQGEIERTDVVSGLHIRNWAAALAAVLTEASTRRGVSLPEVLKKWRTICETDPLPEIRHL
jgi:hypothetical protein